MLKKTITYTDYNGVERKEDFYFNLTQAEVVEMEAGTTGGLAEMIQRIVDAKDLPSIIRVFKDLLLRAYGVKSADGRQFIKIDKDGHRLADDFAQTEAYSIMYMELAFDDIKAAEFVKGVMPAKIDIPAKK